MCRRVGSEKGYKDSLVLIKLEAFAGDYKTLLLPILVFTGIYILKTDLLLNQFHPASAGSYCIKCLKINIYYTLSAR